MQHSWHDSKLLPGSAALFLLILLLFIYIQDHSITLWQLVAILLLWKSGFNPQQATQWTICHWDRSPPILLWWHVSVTWPSKGHLYKT